MIGLHGIGGCGKTTLIKKLAKEAEKLKLFHKIARVELFDHTSITDIQNSIIEWLDLLFPTVHDPGVRASRLRRILTSEKKYLIILDGVWENLDYDAIGIPNHNIVTRSQQVCSLRGCQKEICLGLLDNDEAWELFKSHADIIDENNSSKPLARKISDKCGGLPIAIEAIARSFKGKFEKDWEHDWRMALKNLRDHKPVDIIEEGINPYNRLKSSLDRLRDDDNEAKKLFLLCSLFPEDSEIQVEDLIRSAIGLCIYGESDCYENARKQIDSRMQNLIRSNLLLQGKEGSSVIMHNICRAVVMERAKEIQVVRESMMDVPEEITMKYSYCHIKECPNPFNFPKCEMLFLYQDGKCSLKVSDPFFENKRGLQVLIIVARSSQHTLTLLLFSMNLLTNLQTLCLKKCKLDGKVFLGDLKKLEILEFSKCTITELPLDVAKLQKLRLLDVSGCEIGGNPYEVLGSCSHLEELYFLENQLSEVPSDHNLADFFDKAKGFSPNLERYHLQIGRGKDGIEGNGDLRSKILSISDFVPSTCNATIEDLVKRANVLFLNKIHGDCESIIPGISHTEGMNELVELQVSESNEMKFVIDASQNLSGDGSVLSKLEKLKITGMNSLVALCHGLFPSGLFGKLKELRISNCNSLQGILFPKNLKLHSFEVLELDKCQSLTSLFTPPIAESLEKLRSLKITKCSELKHIIADERSEIDSDDRPSPFVKLQELYVEECHELEYLIPLSLATGLQQLKSLAISRADKLKYVFGESSENQNENQNQIVNLDALEKVELLKLPKIRSICSGKHYPSWPSLREQHNSECPGLSIRAANTSVASTESHGNPANKAEIISMPATIADNFHQPLDAVNDVIKEAEGLMEKGRSRPRNLMQRYVVWREAARKTEKMKYLNQHIFRSRQVPRIVSLPHVDTSEDRFNSKSVALAYKQLWVALKDEEINRIGLHGMAGCGKTSLIREVAKEAEKSSLFHEVIFVDVSSDPNIRNIQGTIATRLRMRFSLEKRILIILDDVWQQLDFKSIGIPSSPHNERCTVVITTRLQQVCTLMDCQKEVSLGLSDDDEAWGLLQKLANITHEDPNILSQAQEISNKCRGLPIAIATLARSLKGKTAADWETALQKFRDHELVGIKDGVGDLYNCLQRSYDNLNDDKAAQDLFLLCSLFPEDSEIQVEDLIRSGTGLGIFRKSDSYRTARREIESTINKLILSNLLLQGKEKGSVILHGLFRDVVWETAKNKIRLNIESGLASPEADQIRYLYCHNQDDGQNPLNFPEFKILLVDKHGDISSEVPDSFLERMDVEKNISYIFPS